MKRRTRVEERNRIRDVKKKRRGAEKCAVCVYFVLWVFFACCGVCVYCVVELFIAVCSVRKKKRSKK